ncbi:MAG: DUF2752 domain-containing protein [Ignavibacteria bacterium]|nr:DUF2752 domain-containing protein [Ignavibacteria bacterium]
MNKKVFKSIFRFFRFNLEAFIWLMSLILLAFMNPENTQATFCVWHYVGFDSCLGCGLGHSISAAFHGHWVQSFEFHPLGIFAIIVLLFRAISLFVQNIFTQSKTYNYVNDL